MSTLVTQRAVPNVRVTSTPRDVIGINTSGSGGGGAQYLVQLLDIISTSLDNNDVLVYDATQSKYVIKELPRVFGGTF